MATYRVGCMGWGYDDWRGVFYPADAAPGEYLERYSRVFDFTEVDSSFYRTPSPFLTRRWAQQTPQGFTFSLKMPRDITHKDPGETLFPQVERFLDSLGPIRDAGKLGPIVAQFPPSFRRDRANGDRRLLAILAAIPTDYAVAVELRHASWFVPDTFRELSERPAALVWSVVPGARPPYVVTDRFLYARFVGDRALTHFEAVQRDQRDEMEAMKRHFDLEGLSARERYVLLNNHFMGFGPGTARILQEVLGLPPADLSLAQRDADQRTLADFG